MIIHCFKHYYHNTKAKYKMKVKYRLGLPSSIQTSEKLC